MKKLSKNNIIGKYLEVTGKSEKEFISDLKNGKAYAIKLFISEYTSTAIMLKGLFIITIVLIFIVIVVTS